MAHMTQEKKKRLKVKIDEAVKEAGFKGRVKYTLSVRHYTELNVNISQSSINLLENVDEFDKESKSVSNLSEYDKKHFKGEAYDCLKVIYDAANSENYNNSDTHVDYFDVGYYLDINIGKLNKPFMYVPD